MHVLKIVHLGVTESGVVKLSNWACHVKSYTQEKKLKAEKQHMLTKYFNSSDPPLALLSMQVKTGTSDASISDSDTVQDIPLVKSSPGKSNIPSSADSDNIPLSTKLDPALTKLGDVPPSVKSDLSSVKLDNPLVKLDSPSSAKLNIPSPGKLAFSSSMKSSPGKSDIPLSVKLDSPSSAKLNIPSPGKLRFPSPMKSSPGKSDIPSSAKLDISVTELSYSDQGFWVAPPIAKK